MSRPEIPYINPDVRYVGVTRLRRMTRTILEELEFPVVVKASGGKELAVIVPWEMYLALQDYARRAPQ